MIFMPDNTVRLTWWAAKRAAELLNSIPETPDAGASSKERAGHTVPSLLSKNPDPVEADLEAAEVNKYLLAKSLFDCREYDRCAAVFLPESLLTGVVPGPAADASARASTPRKDGSGDGAPPAAATSRSRPSLGTGEMPQISQKSLFLALYAKVISGEKRRQEEAEMIMGPNDVGSVVNRHLRMVASYLERCFLKVKNEDGDYVGSQGWLEYL